ncbi:MAG: Bug family tripartite tricarboxylate transporter substrate binding protein [Pseudorhodoplanes sp.]|uniref:Bug family tripartite tricarboxylate transporter substrate binding protein n=1 Tax=Pseudorhodoplanes sp. TaxID=1934341 RepID=UPI003D0E5DD2
MGQKLLVAIALIFGLIQPVSAQEYPTRPVKIVVQFPPGGVPDASARLIAEKLGETLGKPFVVENRPGAGGNIATDLVAKSEPDGHTLLLAASASLVISPNLYRTLPFKVSDLTPISLIGSFDFVMLASPSFAASSVPDLINLARVEPAKINIASSGFGSEHHLVGELFQQSTGIRLTHVPYKGFGPGATDVIAGHIPLMFGSVPASLQLIRSNKVKALAVTGDTRAGALPEVPTFAELGYKDVTMTSWVGVLAPSGTPPFIVEKLAAEIERFVQSSEGRARIDKLGLGLMPPGPRALSDQITSGTRFWADVIKKAGVPQVD